MEINKMHIFVALVFCIGASTTKAQDLGRCADILLEGSYIPTCQNVRGYFKCVIQELNLYEYGTFYGYILDDLEDHLHEALAFLGINCYVDFDDLVEEIRDEEGYYQHVPTTTTKRPKEYDACASKPCGQMCTNLGGGAYQCSCNSGYRRSRLFPDKCVDIDECKENQYLCKGKCVNTEGSFRCECPQGYTLGSDGSSCDLITPGYHGCVNNKPGGCSGVPNGDYAVCGPECQRGVYITCSNSLLHLRWCATGWYQYPKGQRFEDKLVFDPILRTCERNAKSCPRMLDNYVERA